MRPLTLLFFIPMCWFCRRSPEESLPTTPTPVPTPIDILALGDSYTKGENVKWEQNFPNQLADSLKISGLNIKGPHVVAQTGWRTDNLQSAIASQSNVLGDSVFGLVTLCIGVNNQYQGAPLHTYKQQFEALLQYALARTGQRKDRVVVLSIPDWAYTPFGQNSGNPPMVSQQIDQYNAANKAIADTYGVHYVDVTEISRQGLTKPEFVAADGLHPSAQQYTEWVVRLLPYLRTTLGQ